MKKITLIEPKSPGFHFFSKYPMPRLGLPIIGALLKSKGYGVKIYFEEIKEIDFSEVYNSDLVGISTITATAPRAYAIADKVRKAGIPVMLGGVHPTFLPDEALEHADYVIRGEGEYTVTELVEALEHKKPLAEIAGLSYKIDDRPQHNPICPFIDDLDQLPAPDFSLIEGNQKLGIIPIAASRGCPFDCNFCSVTAMFGRKYRYREVDGVLEEVYRYKNHHLFFCDDNFTANRNHTKALLEKMLAQKLTPSWSAQVRTDVVKDKELLKLMKRANCKTLFIGFESINPKTLEAYNKRQDVDDIKACIRILHQYGINIHGMFVLGSDEDDTITIRQTGSFATKMGIDSIQFSILTPLPGSRLYGDLDSQGRILTKDWSLYDGLHVVSVPKQIMPDELQIETFKAMKRFYSFRQFVKLLFQSKVSHALIRALGNNLIRKWEHHNKKYIKELKSITSLLRMPEIISSALEFMENAIRFSAQALFVTEEKTKDSVRELVEKGNLDKGTEQKMLQRLLNKVGNHSNIFPEGLEETIQRVKAKIIIPSPKQLTELEEHLQQLNKKIGSLAKVNFKGGNVLISK